MNNLNLANSKLNLIVYYYILYINKENIENKISFVQEESYDDDARTTPTWGYQLHLCEPMCLYSCLTTTKTKQKQKIKVLM